MKQNFSTKWKESKQPRKQRKYRANAPLHIRKKFVNLNLSKDLRKKYPKEGHKQNKRSIQARKGDKVKIMRGKFKGEVGKIIEVNLKSSKIIIEGVQAKKQDGSKVNLKLQPSNLQIIELSERLKKTQTEKKIIEPKKEQAITDSKKPEIQKKEVQKVKKEKTELNAGVKK